MRGARTFALNVNWIIGRIEGSRRMAGERREPTRVERTLDLEEARWDYPTMVITLDAKRRLTVPTGLAPAKPGDVFEADFDPEEDAIVFRRISRNGNWLAVLEECPVPMDDLPPRRRESFRSRL